MISSIFFLYTINCGVNYYRKPFSSYLDYEVGVPSQGELLELCAFLTDKVNEYAGQAGIRESIGEYNEQGVLAMKRLAGQYPQLDGYYPKPKALCVSWILSVQQLSGIYAPFTIEANYNQDITSYNIPLTLCHELSHLKGFMREEEANFIGYLACIGFDSPQFQYSGYMMGWIYATNALAQTDVSSYGVLCRKLDDRVAADLQANSMFWEQYEGKVAEAATKVNDTYLKMNDQSRGVKSYGQVVDLMLAHYRQMVLVETGQ